MSFFAGMIGTGPEEGSASLASMDDLRRVALRQGGNAPRCWQGRGAVLAQVSVPITPEDHFDDLPRSVAMDRGVLVFDGRLDNRDDLIRDLAIGPERSARLGDGALAAAALERWGDGACIRMIGDFALAWWDQPRRTLMLACDSDGGRTVYYHTGPRGLVFATRPLAVQALAGTPRVVNRLTMAYMLLARTPPADLTPYQGISRLPAAGRLVWTPDAVRVDRYWRPDCTRKIRFKRADDYVEAGREMLDRVVRARLRLEGPVVCQLSAGLDSPAVAATAARLSAPGIVHTITTTPAPGAPLPTEPPHLIFDEWPLAQEVAALYPNMVAHRAPAGPLIEEERDPARIFETFGWPVRNPLNFAVFRPGFLKARELGAKVILSGLAGNPGLTWQSTALPADLLASGHWLAAARQVAGLRRDGVPWGNILALRLIGPLLSLEAKRAWRRLRGRPVEPWHRQSALSRSFAEEIGAGRLCDEFWLTLEAPTRDAHDRLRLLEEHWSRRQFMAAHPYVSGCELRDPLGDRRMVEFCLALPDGQWQLDGVPRAYGRRVIADRVPPSIFENRRHGFQCADWHVRMQAVRGSMADEIDRLERSATARDMLDLSRMRAVLAEWPEDADADQARERGLQTVLNRGLHCGAFIRWVEGGN